MIRYVLELMHALQDINIYRAMTTVVLVVIYVTLLSLHFGPIYHQWVLRQQRIECFY